MSAPVSAPVSTPIGMTPSGNMCTALLHHLRATPEMARLGKEVFYKTNTFKLQPSCSTLYPIINPQYQPTPLGTRYLAYPNRTVQGLIRRIEFEFVLGDPAEWRHLVRFARGNYGFRALRYVTVVGEWGRSFLPALRSVQGCVDVMAGQMHGCARFSCDGEVVFRARVSDIFRVTLGAEIEVNERLEGLVKGKILFKQASGRRD